MAWMGSTKIPQERPVTIFVHDIPYLNGKNIALEPYSERLQILDKLIPDKGISAATYKLVKAISWEAKNFEQLKQALEKAEEFPGSEGAMIKWSNFEYMPKLLASIVKFKVPLEVDCLIIGYRKVIPAKPPGVKWTAKEAFKHLEKSLKESQTYIFRVALRHKDGWVPLESDKILAPGDLKLTWDEERQKWKGLDDPKYWTMFDPFPHRGHGEYAYANTYAIKCEEPPKKGQVVTVAPMELRPFKKEDGTWGLAWMFPRVRNLKDVGDPVSTLEAAFYAFAQKLPEDMKFSVIRESCPLDDAQLEEIEWFEAEDEKIRDLVQKGGLILKL
jgi:hypothetical protein